MAASWDLTQRRKDAKTQKGEEKPKFCAFLRLCAFAPLR
jgi:hypothetical protein